jgi:large subunit ribosomal protein L25
MASSYYKLNIENRTLTRTKGAKALRRNDTIPGVLYYKGDETINVAINKLALYQAIHSGQRIYEIEIAGDTQYVMVKELQYHPVNDNVIHIDLMRVRRSEKIKIAVPLVLIGEAAGIKEGGVLSQAMTQVEIECFPTDVPEKIELDITELEMNSAYSVADVKVTDEEITILSALDLNVVSIHPPAAEEEPLVEEEEMIEGEEIEGEEGTETPDEESKDEGDKEKTGDSAEKS